MKSLKKLMRNLFSSITRDNFLKLAEMSTEELERQEAYVCWSRAQEDLPIWYREWWLNAVCGQKKWSAFLVYQNNEIVGVLPYVYSKILWLKILHDPPLTQASGPWISNNLKLKSRERDYYMENLAKQVSNYPLYVQHWHKSVDNWLPFYWNAFNQTTKFTNVLSLNLNTEALRTNLNSRAKRSIKKAESFPDFEVIFEEEADTLIQACEKSFKRQGLTKKIDTELIKKVASEAFRQDAIFILTVRRKCDSMVAASAMFILDGKSAIYLLGGVDSGLRNGGFMSLLMWKAIEHCKKLDLEDFDFEGSMTKSIDNFFQNFGAVRVPYFRVSYASSFALRAILDRFLK